MIRQTIVTESIDILKNIKKENGFYSSVGDNCFEWYEKKLDKEEYPAIFFRDSEDTVVISSSSWEHTLRIEIDIATNGKNTMLYAREIISDVLTAFKDIEKKINYETTYKGCETIQEQADYAYSGTRMVFTIKYNTRPWEQ